jgi:hypothetical protein
LDGEAADSRDGYGKYDVNNIGDDRRRGVGGLVKGMSRQCFCFDPSLDDVDLLEDHQSPTYILMDEEDYESIVAQMKHSVLMSGYSHPCLPG